MPRFKTRRCAHYHSEQMFALVADVESYPEFLPMCKALTIRSCSERDEETFLITDMTVGYGLIRETFTTQVDLQPYKKINARYIDDSGPFKYLENYWSFFPIKGDSICEIEFFINYEFRDSIFSVMMGTIFDVTIRKSIDAFERRADEIYAIL